MEKKLLKYLLIWSGAAEKKTQWHVELAQSQ
jgi:hypothetical protein